MLQPTRLGTVEPLAWVGLGRSAHSRLSGLLRGGQGVLPLPGVRTDRRIGRVRHTQPLSVAGVWVNERAAAQCWGNSPAARRSHRRDVARR